MSILLNSQINIITGDNGSGKSTLLSDIAEEQFKLGKNVICISNTTTNKFKIKKSSRYNTFKQTSNSLDNSIKKLILRTFPHSDTEHNANIFGSVLEYLNFSNYIVFNIVLFPHESFLRKFESEIFNNERSEYEIKEILNYFRNTIYINKDNDESLDKSTTHPSNVNFEYYFGNQWDKNIYNPPIELILKYERLLKKHGLLFKININLVRENHYIPTSQISSGEASYLTALAFTLPKLETNTLIIIDEPENSLHPRWQKNYISNILNLLNYFEPTLILATHSPMIVIGAVEDNGELSIYKANNFNLTLLNSNDTNIDEVMVDVFGVLTSRSRYFSYRVNEILTEYQNRKSTFAETTHRLNQLQSLGPDDKQENIIIAAHQILQEMGKNA